MILWPIVSGFLFWKMFFGTNEQTRRTCSILFAGWMMLSVGLLLVGVVPGSVD